MLNVMLGNYFQPLKEKVKVDLFKTTLKKRVMVKLKIISKSFSDQYFLS